MTRTEAEQLAYTRNTNDKLNNHVARPCRDNPSMWEVVAFSVHSRIIRSRD